MLKRWAAWPRGNRWLAGIAAVVLGLAIAWVLFVPIADWLAHHDVGSATGPLHETALDNARGRLLTLTAGVFAAGALAFTARNFTLSRRTLDVTEQGQVTDRYTKAIEQLGSDKLDVRIGGTYALERVARDSARDHPTVMEVLTAFIREHSREPWPPPDDGGQEPERSTRPDVQAALTVIGRRDAKHDIPFQAIDLTGADLRGAYLTDDADLRGTHLTGADLRGAYLTFALLSGTHLRGADLRAANLLGADLRGADLRGADLRAANLLSADLCGADLRSADLRSAYLTDLTNADRDILGDAYRRDAYLGDADRLDAYLRDADYLDPFLRDADLRDARWPEDAPVPEGWKLNTGTGRLVAADGGAETAEASPETG